ncbi:MAG: dynamin family protein [Sporomusaceae bacterium]|nr:dynamin family protein [Sporomusaceae bacterium]
MYQEIIHVIRKEVIRLLNEQAHGIFTTLLQTPDLFKKQDQQRNVSDEAIQQWTEVLKDEAYKVKHSEVTFVVIGTMKSGKSTTINAIVGNELLPNRNQPMTILPTIIRHCSGKTEPELTFSNPLPFNELIGMLRKKLKEKESHGELDQIAFCATADGTELVRKVLDGSSGEIRQHYQGNENIFTFLKYVNDIWRLCSTDDIAINIDHYLNQYHKIQDLPAIEVEFFHLRDQEHQGRFALIDTPGPNEAGQTFLRNIIADHLEKSSAVIIILDYTQMNTEAEVEIRKSLNEIPYAARNRLYVLVNKFDQKDRNGMSVEALRSYVATQLFEGQLDKEQVFPVSSKHAYLANRALRELSVNGKLPDYEVNPWIEDFGQLALGACWESEIGDVQQVEYRANKLWEKSLFEHPLAKVVKNGSEHAAITSLKSAIAKMLEYDKQISESIQFRINALRTDIAVIDSHISYLEEDICIVKNARADLRMIINKGIDTLQDKFYILFDESAELLKERIKVEFNLTPYEDFSTEEDARKLLGKLAEVVTAKLHFIQQNAKKDVDEVLESIWMEATKPLESVLKTAGERWYESFSVTLDFPRPTILTVFDSDKLFHSSIKKESVTKVGTMHERRWYTLWSHKHKLTYEYQAQVYRIYTKDVLEQLQKSFTEDSNGIWISLDDYVRNEFNEAIKAYFIEAFDYLEKLKGDLLEAKHDQGLKSGRIEDLQAAMGKLLKRLSAHHKDVELLGRSFLMRCRPDKVAG